MSETDSFIQEVTEEVRQDRMLAYWKKWGPFILGGVVLVVGAAAAWSWWQSQKQAQAEARGAIFIAADPEETADLLALPDRVDGSAKLIADLAAAGGLAADGKHEEAAQAYRAVAGQADAGRAYTDLASLQALRMDAAAGKTDGLIEALAPLAGEDAPYRLLAMELRAALQIKAGETEAAYADLNAILADPATTTDLRRRAIAILTATGGSAPDPA